jgi:hypothetical protein
MCAKICGKPELPGKACTSETHNDSSRFYLITVLIQRICQGMCMSASWRNLLQTATAVAEELPSLFLVNIYTYIHTHVHRHTHTDSTVGQSIQTSVTKPSYPGSDWERLHQRLRLGIPKARVNSVRVHACDVTRYDLKTGSCWQKVWRGSRSLSDTVMPSRL